jgi:hypothetical protein
VELGIASLSKNPIHLPLVLNQKKQKSSQQLVGVGTVASLTLREPYIQVVLYFEDQYVD